MADHYGPTHHGARPTGPVTDDQILFAAHAVPDPNPPFHHEHPDGERPDSALGTRAEGAR